MRPRFHRRRYASSVYTSVAGVSPFTRNIQLERIPSCIFFLGKLYATPRTRTPPRIFTRITVLSFRVKNFAALRSFEPDRDLTRSETRRCSRSSAARTPPIVEQKTPSVTWNRLAFSRQFGKPARVMNVTMPSKMFA